jgi:hypothetical protein
MDVDRNLKTSEPGQSGYPEMMTAKDLEALLQIDVKTIYSYVQRGLIPYVRIQSNVRFVRRQIFDWIGEHNYQPRPVNGNGRRQ